MSMIQPYNLTILNNYPYNDKSEDKEKAKEQIDALTKQKEAFSSICHDGLGLKLEPESSRIAAGTGIINFNNIGTVTEF